jgi:hypothetical protein
VLCRDFLSNLHIEKDVSMIFENDASINIIDMSTKQMFFWNNDPK